MTNYRLLIKRLPVHNDVLTIKTHPRGTVGVQFYRDFVVYANGEEIARIMQTSVSANPDTHKILRPKVFLAYNIFQDAKVPPEDRVDRLTVPEGTSIFGRAAHLLFGPGFQPPSQQCGLWGRADGLPARRDAPAAAAENPNQLYQREQSGGDAQKSTAAPQRAAGFSYTATTSAA